MKKKYSFKDISNGTFPNTLTTANKVHLYVSPISKHFKMAYSMPTKFYILHFFGQLDLFTILANFLQISNLVLWQTTNCHVNDVMLFAMPLQYVEFLLALFAAAVIK